MLFSKTYFLFHAEAIHDVMKFKILKFQNLNISRTKNIFEKKKIFFLLFPKVLIFGLKKQNSKIIWNITYKKQNSKNLSDITFKKNKASHRIRFIGLRPATLLKRDSGKGVFLIILRNF